MSNEIKAAYDTLKESVQDDPGYAWSWHCNIAMAIKDSGIEVSLADANIAAALTMDRLFGVSTLSNINYK